MPVCVRIFFTSENVRPNFDLKHSHVLVLHGEVMRGLGGDLHLGRCGKGGQQREDQQRSEGEAFHAGGFEYPSPATRS